MEKSRGKRRRNFLMNPYGNASIKYGEMRMNNCFEERGEELVRRTPDGRFLMTANPNGTFSVYPLTDVSSYRIALETYHTTITHIVVEEKVTQVLPNYEIGPNGVIMKMMFNPHHDYLRGLPNVPNFTVRLSDEVDARRFDFRNGNDIDDHWVSIVTLTTKAPEQRRPMFDRILRVGYNGHYATDLLFQFVKSHARTFGKGFVPPRVDKEEISDDDTVVTNPEPDEEDLEEYDRKRRVKLVKSIENPSVTPIENWFQVAPSHRTTLADNRVTSEELQQAINTATNVTPIRNTARYYMEVKPSTEKTGNVKRTDEAVTNMRKVHDRQIDMPELVTTKGTQTGECEKGKSEQSDENWLKEFAKERASAEFRQDQSRPPVHSGKPLTIPTTQAVARVYRPRWHAGSLWSETSGRTSDTADEVEGGIEKPVGKKSGPSESSKSGEKTGKNKKSGDIAAALCTELVKSITEALNKMTKKYQSESSDADTEEKDD